MPTSSAQVEIGQFMTGLVRHNPGETEFHQAVQEVAESVVPFLADHLEYRAAQIFERMTEPDRIISFRVCWEDDAGNIRVNRGTRIQFNNVIGPYKGGIRFHPSVTLSVLKFLGFEQTFKNSLTPLPMGGAQGGANFNPKGKSDREVMRFCQAFMIELSRHIGSDVDIPAGDIGVGPREISYLFGQFKRLRNEFTGVLTGNVYFVAEMLKTRGDGMKDKVCVISGSGNVAQYTAEKAIELGAKVVTMSDSSGFVYDRSRIRWPHGGADCHQRRVPCDGIDGEKLAYIIELKTVRRGRIAEYAERYGCEYHDGQRPWGVPCDAAFPSTTENEIDARDATSLVGNGVLVVGEGANMPTTIEGVHVFQNGGILYAPSKAANAGGVAVSGLEQTQNAMRLQWSRGEVDMRLREIMADIHAQCAAYRSEGDRINYVKGATTGGFVKVADAMLAYGVV